MSKQLFWVLSSPESLSKKAEWDHEVMDMEQVICPIDPGHQRGGKRLGDLNVELPSGSVQDFVWTWYSECLIQDHVLATFLNERFSGFEVKPVVAKFKSGAKGIPVLWELVKTGWSGMARPESGIERTLYCDACKHAKYSGIKDGSQLIDESKWDGCDFFAVWPLPGFIFVTQRVVDCIRDHRLTGVVPKPVDTMSGVGLDSGLGGGRMSYWMPESRAHELGKTAGIAEI